MWHCLRDFRASVASQPASLSAKGSSLLGRSGVANFASTMPPFKHFLMVLRDSPVQRAISRIASFSRNAKRRMMFKSPMWITPLLPAAVPWGKITWVKSQWKSCS